MAGPSRCTDYKCSEGHTFYSYATHVIRACPFPKCNGVVTAVRGWLAKKKGADA